MSGYSKDTVFRLLLYLLIIIIVAYVAVEVFGTEYKDYLPTKNPLPEAIRCSYYRCTDGCDAVENIMITTREERVNCRAQFCDPYKDGDGKVCDDNARAHPVVVETDTDLPIAEDKLEFADCLMKEVSYESVSAGDMTVVIVDLNDVIEEEESGICRGLHLIGGNYKELKVKKNKYYIWTWTGPGIPPFGAKKDTSVSTQSPT